MHRLITENTSSDESRERLNRFLTSFAIRPASLQQALGRLEPRDNPFEGMRTITDENCSHFDVVLGGYAISISGSNPRLAHVPETRFALYNGSALGVRGYGPRFRLHSQHMNQDYFSLRARKSRGVVTILRVHEVAAKMRRDYDVDIRYYRTFRLPRHQRIALGQVPLLKCLGIVMETLDLLILGTINEVVLRQKINREDGWLVSNPAGSLWACDLRRRLIDQHGLPSTSYQGLNIACPLRQPITYTSWTQEQHDIVNEFFGPALALISANHKVRTLKLLHRVQRELWSRGWRRPYREIQCLWSLVSANSRSYVNSSFVSSYQLQCCIKTYAERQRYLADKGGRFYSLDLSWPDWCLVLDDFASQPDLNEWSQAVFGRDRAQRWFWFRNFWFQYSEKILYKKWWNMLAGRQQLSP
jgi:hypothetical protein